MSGWARDLLLAAADRPGGSGVLRIKRMIDKLDDRQRAEIRKYLGRG
jgi:hypothetical protein